MKTADRVAWVWDYDLSEEEYRTLLTGERTIGWLDRNRSGRSRMPTELHAGRRPIGAW